MEELFYWLVILAFYLFSVYRSRKKKAIPRPLEKEVKDVIPAVPPQTKSVLDFLNDAFEKMEAEVDINMFRKEQEEWFNEKVHKVE